MADLSHMTGESNYKRGQAFDEITLDGNKGRFLLRDKDAERGADGKYPKTDLGAGATVSYDPATGKPTVSGATPLEVVFLKIRRTIGDYESSRRSNEHNHKNERIVLYGPEKGQKEVGIGADLAEKYQDLRVSQIVYSYVPSMDAVVKIVFKGASLGSKGGVKGALKFYDYLQSFTKDEHMYEYVTKLVPVLETNPDLNKDYFCVTFERGAKLDETMLKTATDHLVQIHEDITRRDKEFLERLVGGDAIVSVPEDQAAPSIDYPDISPDEIPFN